MNREKIIFFTFVIILFFIPNILWSKLYLLGGDDSKLYLLFPLEFIKNYTQNLISTNVEGGLGVYIAPHFLIPFVGLIFLLKKIFFFTNIEYCLFGLNLAGGFTFFYLLLGLFIKEKDWNRFWIRIISSLFYVFSIYSFYTVWNSQSAGVYLVLIFPLLLYLFLKAVYTNELKYIVFCALTLFFFSIWLLTLPWLLAELIAVLPLLYIVFREHKKRFIYFSLNLLILVVALNFYWLLHFIYSPFSTDQISSGSLSTITNSNFIADNENLIRSVSQHNRLTYPLLNLYHRQIQIDYNWRTSGIFENWHLKLAPLNFVFILILLLAGISLKKIPRKLAFTYLSLLLSWLITLFYFTANIGNWGINLFILLTTKIPLFILFRNMYDKFSPAMGFIYAFTLAISLSIIASSKKGIQLKILLFITFLVVILNAKPFILGEYFNSALYTTTNSYTTISDLNSNFYDLIKYLNSIDDPSRFIWLPLNNANYVQIQDKYLSNHYYSGVSPLQYLAKKSDFDGKLSFGQLGSKLFNDYILKKDYKNVGLFFQKMNIRYIIVNHSIGKDLQTSYLYGRDLYDAQINPEFMNIILGEKIKDFGLYSLYKINRSFDSQKIFISSPQNDNEVDPSTTQFTRITNYKYEIKIRNLKNSSQLVFLDPYHKQWKLYFKNGKSFYEGTHEVIYDYANSWDIDPTNIKTKFAANNYSINNNGGIDLDLILYFVPQDYVGVGFAISFFSLFVCGFYLAIVYAKDLKQKLSKMDIE